MKLNDSITQSVAAAVSDVVEGRTKIQEMDPKKHVKQDEKTGMYCVYNNKGDKVKEFKSKEDAEKYAVDNHDDLMKEYEEPRAKGEKDFKDKHVVKKSGEKEDGTVTKEAVNKEGNAFTKALMAAKKNGDDTFVVAGKKYKVEDYDKDDEDDKEEMDEARSKFPKSLLKKASELALKMGGDMTGAVKKIEKMKKGLSDDPEVKAALQLANEAYHDDEKKDKKDVKEMSKKEKYQKVFQAALKKFGVKSPGELEGDKKKEFFDYVDAQYDAGENETD
tara:strand:+ start:314 stop:1141 length:828 start_codon:yes stop_codon:yes gene_type:complete